MTTPPQQNAADLELDLDWLGRMVDARLRTYFGQENGVPDASIPGPPALSPGSSPYADLVHQLELNPAERTALVLALAPHLRPRLLDVFFTRNSTFDRRFTEFGGAIAPAEGPFRPTGETLAFLLGENDLATRFEVLELFDRDRTLNRHDVVRLNRGPAEQGFLAGLLEVSEDVLGRVTQGRPRRPEFGSHFPARFIETALEWDDLVLHPQTLRQVADIETWIRHGATLMDDWQMARKLRPGHRALFHGPPGTGKTMTACILGKRTGREVYLVDLSLVVSKYIGETEKNLARVFDQAQSRDWILFFDEADALFGKRSETRDAHDRYANQEVAFLLQRIEVFDGIAILASNMRENLDDAFTRRFESIVYFPMPQPEERLQLWQRGLSPKARLDPGLDLSGIARDHALSGGSIMNVIRYASLKALDRDAEVITRDDVLQGIRHEYEKQGQVS